VARGRCCGALGGIKMETPDTKPFSKKKIVVVASFFVLFGIAMIVAGFHFHQSEDSWSWDYWGIKYVTIGIGTVVIFGIALVQGLVLLCSRQRKK
jgi:nitrate reductase gamma subunit